MEKLFNPGSVAVIGASEVPGKAAERRTRSLLEGGYRGQVFLINPKRKELFGRRSYSSILEVDGDVDLVMIIVPPRFVLPAVSESVRKGAKGIIIITAGLGEIGESGNPKLRKSEINDFVEFIVTTCWQILLICMHEQQNHEFIVKPQLNICNNT